MNQRKVLSRWGGSVALWAWFISITLHLVVLAALGVLKFSRSDADYKHRPVPMATVSQVKELIEANPVIPKPKIKKSIGDRFRESPRKLLPANQIFGAAKPSSPSISDFARPSAPTGVSSASGANLPRGIEFFGSRTDRRKVCYVVDCSGSMQGVFRRVQKKLKDSIVALQPDQYFYIIFFGNNRLFEFGDGRLLRATEQARSAACDFIESIQPAGRTNAVAALERAVQIRDSFGVSPSVIYFLTDGFELTMEDAGKFSQKISNLLKSFAPTAKINTIGFWPQSNDRKMLEIIAEQSGGEALIIDY
ncbi:MAG: hypothetical protein DRP62_04375 [Planctomycetota bacterium]|nr:MAG: hypothetical protein DRP62_04375 [Planctomycetota bacterium]